MIYKLYAGEFAVNRVKRPGMPEGWADDYWLSGRHLQCSSPEMSTSFQAHLTQNRANFLMLEVRLFFSQSVLLEVY